MSGRWVWQWAKRSDALSDDCRLDFVRANGLEFMAVNLNSLPRLLYSDEITLKVVVPVLISILMVFHVE